MDELMLLRNAREDVPEPDAATLAVGRAALLNHIADHRGPHTTRLPRYRGPALPRARWVLSAAGASVAAVVVAGSLSLSAGSAYAGSVLAKASAQTIDYADLTPGSDEYLRSRTHARWQTCTYGRDTQQPTCAPNDQILDVYMPADPTATWVLHRNWGKNRAATTDGSVELIRAAGGRFYGPGSPWTEVDYADIPTDGAAAYDWINNHYAGGSASRDEDNFARITGILSSGLVPALQRSALLDALSRIPGVTATDGVANLDGVTGVAIGRDEPVRLGERREIIIDPATGLIIGERTSSGAALFGWEINQVVEVTAIETTTTTTTP